MELQKQLAYEFNLKEVFCHKNNCQKSSNPEKHDNCCYAKWVRRRKSLEKSLINAKNLASEISRKKIPLLSS